MAFLRRLQVSNLESSRDTLAAFGGMRKEITSYAEDAGLREKRSVKKQSLLSHLSSQSRIREGKKLFTFIMRGVR